MKRTIAFIFLFFCALSPNYSQIKSLKWVPFYWQADTISGKIIDKAYIYIPIQIDFLPNRFSMQLDLGTPDTQFYGKTIQPILKRYPTLAKKLSSYNQHKNIIFKGVNIQMGGINHTINIWNRNDFGEEISTDLLKSNSPIHIGTIASDFFRDKVLIIDYKLNRFAINDYLPTEFSKLPSVKFELLNGLIVFQLEIDGVKRRVMFDTGSSVFPLATSKENAYKISNHKIIDSLSGPLWWGENITFYALNVNRPIKFNSKRIENSIVYYDKDGLWEKNIFKPLNIWGLTGNAFFLDRTIVIDFKNKLFII